MVETLGTISNSTTGAERDARRTIARSDRPADPLLARFVDGLERALVHAGYASLPEPGADVNVVLHPVDVAKPRPYRRKAAPTFVIAIGALPRPTDDPLRTGYPILVRALANLCVLVSSTSDGLAVQFVTLEQGRYTVGPGLSDDELFAQVAQRVEPLASSRLVIANRFVTDLPESLWDGDEQTRGMLQAGRNLDALALLPSPFPLEEILSSRDLRHVKLLYGIGGLSYGNLSTRYRGPLRGVPDPDGPVYWMSASGGDKAELRAVGEDILLVRGYDRAGDTMVLSVPPAVTPRRVSVDAIEHFMIYGEHPNVGAIVHVHGWIDGTTSTEVNYPCGTVQLASSVAELVRRQPDPSRAVVGLRNHGLTITGHSLDEIFDRVGEQIVPRVPMV
ncbi:MAG: class aldolase/adducin family protein [Actinomycetia bacterium]|nr:class aldolase/adducin family protein [Actinomycetes bacterium]